MDWLAGRRGRRFEISSPLPMDAALARLHEGLEGRRGTFGASFGPAGVVRGNVRHDTVNLVAMHAGLGIWSPTTLRGRLRAAPTGCALDYDVGWSQPAQLLGSVWLGAALLVFAGGAGAAVHQLVTGHAGVAGTPGVVAGVAAGVALLLLGLVAAARAASRDQVALLHSWVAERLRSKS
ncbi:hypothetical protein ACQP1P_00130 [Dactylosporangium sp. CA-052675]|uniref:hypothetical protein n=1 Tax=Dactylosporangium sp. CA-052675 TaxID=3239927 RepID=UPI003D8A950F